MGETERTVAFLMTCGHMSEDRDKCPYECPDSKVLESAIVEVESVEPTSEETTSD